MVLRKRPDYRINAFPGPVIPRGPRSVRKWSPHKKNVEDGQNYAFELLASIAGKLLLESESSISSNASEGKDRPIIERDNIIKQEQSDEDKPSKPELVEKFSFRNYCNKIEGGSPDYGESNNIENGIEKQQGGKELEIGNLKKEYYAKSQAMLILDSNVKLPLPSDAISGSSFSTHSNGINKLGSRDDDQNFSGCYKPSTKFNSFRPSSRIVGRRIRKLLNSKYWKVAPKLRDCEVSRSGFVDGGMKPFYRKRKMCYGDRCQCNTSYKRRRCFDRSSVVTAYGGMSSESVSNSPEKGLNIDKSASSAMLHGGPSSSSESSHVKFSIKSFKVPEFFIDVPEDATVGSLKRTVMETVTAIFGSGLHVGVLLQGKKIWDDNTTLSETGLSSKENLDTLGFTLEPNPLQPSPVTYPTEDPPPHLPRDPSNLLTRSTYGALPETSLTNTVNNDESNNESVSSLNDMLTEKSSAYSKALVVVPEISMGPLNVVAPVNQKKNAWEMSMEGLAVVPANPKTKNSELAQRRTRRPFSVTEVEALVEAVEELGTGRWRDVKIRSFENADHRTYVDLKDKWKTLVHTARISPQQRRGEPVPQELLDRVLAAHAYWAQHQAKQHGKSQGGNL